MSDDKYDPKFGTEEIEPGVYIVTGTKQPGDKVRSVMEIAEEMGKPLPPHRDTNEDREVERKWAIPWTLDSVGIMKPQEKDLSRISQAYIGTPDEEMEVRVRETRGGSWPPSHTLTVKAGMPPDRFEREQEIGHDMFARIYKQSPYTIEKDRFEFPLAGGLVAEVDVYEKPETVGVSLLEVEFEDRAHAEDFDPGTQLPIQGAVEVTLDDRFTNREIAKNRSMPYDITDFPSAVSFLDHEQQ